MGRINFNWFKKDKKVKSYVRMNTIWFCNIDLVILILWYWLCKKQNGNKVVVIIIVCITIGSKIQECYKFFVGVYYF